MLKTFQSVTIATLLNIQTTTKQNLFALNNAFVEIYDLVTQSISPDSPLYPNKDGTLGRLWNSKGNSVEALALLPAELATTL